MVSEKNMKFWDFCQGADPFLFKNFVLILQNYLPISVLDVIILLWVGVGKNLGAAQDGLTLSATEIFYFFVSTQLYICRSRSLSRAALCPGSGTPTPLPFTHPFTGNLWPLTLFVNFYRNQVLPWLPLMGPDLCQSFQRLLLSFIDQPKADK